MNVQFRTDMNLSPLMNQNKRITSVIAINGTLSRIRLIQTLPSGESHEGNSIDSSLIWSYRLFLEYAFGGHCHSTPSQPVNSFDKLVDGHLIPKNSLEVVLDVRRPSDQLI